MCRSGLEKLAFHFLGPFRQLLGCFFVLPQVHYRNEGVPQAVEGEHDLASMLSLEEECSGVHVVHVPLFMKVSLDLDLSQCLIFEGDQLRYFHVLTAAEAARLHGTRFCCLRPPRVTARFSTAYFLSVDCLLYLSSQKVRAANRSKASLRCTTPESVKLELDKENRLPRSMAQAEKKAKALTPGRPKKAGNQFFDVGKIGRYAHVQ